MFARVYLLHVHEIICTCPSLSSPSTTYAGGLPRVGHNGPYCYLIPHIKMPNRRLMNENRCLQSDHDLSGSEVPETMKGEGQEGRGWDRDWGAIFEVRVMQ